MINIALRQLNDADVDLLAKWLQKDYILKWYGDTADWLREIEERNGEFKWIRHFIVTENDVPLGFCQYYDCCDANSMEDWYDVTEQGCTFSIDYLIGDENYLGKGYGKAIVGLLTETVRRNENARQIIVQPDEDNFASVKVLTANGYVFDECKNYYCKQLK